MANWINDLFGGRDAVTDKGDNLAQNPEQAQQSKASGSDYPHYTQYRDSYGTNKDGSKSVMVQLKLVLGINLIKKVHQKIKHHIYMMKITP